jgi:hypothetical protein
VVAQQKQLTKQSQSSSAFERLGRPKAAEMTTTAATSRVLTKV